MTDLRERFDQVLEALEATDGWATARVARPLLILGSLDGVETGIRQLVRARPLEIEQIAVGGHTVRVPTVAEMLRIKAWLVLRRNATRDYLDLVALADRLGADAARVALTIDLYYADQQGSGGRRVATQLAKQLAEPAPYDLSEVDLRYYRRLVPRWRDWNAVVAACRSLAAQMLDLIAPGRGMTVSHRHLDYPSDVPVPDQGLAALDDVLDRGDLESWAPLAAAVRRDPWGELASAVLRLCEAHPMYGSSSLWRTWIADLRASRRDATVLAALRRNRGLTQQDVAVRLGIGQSDVSKLERRRDVRVSTLRAYVEATGGRLEMRARYADDEVEIQLPSVLGDDGSNGAHDV